MKRAAHAARTHALQPSMFPKNEAYHRGGMRPFLVGRVISSVHAEVGSKLGSSSDFRPNVCCVDVQYLYVVYARTLQSHAERTKDKRLFIANSHTRTRTHHLLWSWGAKLARFVATNNSVLQEDRLGCSLYDLTSLVGC